MKQKLKQVISRWPWLQHTIRRVRHRHLSEPPSAISVGDGTLFPGFSVTTDDVLLDVGCGAGQPCVVAGQVGADVLAIDIDPAAIAQVEHNMLSVPARSFRAILSDCDPIPLSDGIATIVVAQEVIEHVDHPRRFLAELARVGRPGARYFLSVPDPASEELMRSVVPESYFQKPGHQRVIARSEFVELVVEAGLVVEQRIPFGFYWTMWWALLWSTGPAYAPGSSLPYPEILAHWDRVWQLLQQTPKGAGLLRSLEETLPKSQILFARKPG